MSEARTLFPGCKRMFVHMVPELYFIPKFEKKTLMLMYMKMSEVGWKVEDQKLWLCILF